MPPPKICTKRFIRPLQIDQEDLENALEKLEEAQPTYDLIGNIQIRFSSGGNYYVEIVDDSETKKVIAIHKKTTPYSSLDELKDGIIKTVNYFKYDFTEEGIFLVEHLLLKPTFKDYKLIGGIGCMSINETFKIFQNMEGIGYMTIGNTFEVFSS